MKWPKVMSLTQTEVTAVAEGNVEPYTNTSKLEWYKTGDLLNEGVFLTCSFVRVSNVTFQ